MYNLIFKNGEIADINDNQALSLLNDWTNGKEKFILNGSLRGFSSVSDIKPVREDKYEKLPEVKTTWTKNKRLNALRSMRSGFLRGISNPNNPTTFQKQFIKNIDERIAETEKSSQETYPGFNSVRDVGFEMP